MRFGFINIGAKHKFYNYANLLSLKGYYLYFAYDYAAADEISDFSSIISACDIVFVSADRAKFAEIFNIAEINLTDSYIEIGTLLYVFLDDETGIKNAESIIKDYYSRLNIKMGLYRLFLEQGKNIGIDSLFDPQKSEIKDKYSLTYQKNGHFLDIIIRYRNDSRITSVKKQILENCFNYIYSTNFCNISELIASTLIKNKSKIKFAESFTGGRLAASLTAIPGASNFLSESIVAYSDCSKTERLQISKNILQQRGAVSAEVAFEMARSLMRSGCDIAVSTTGNAGPTAQNHGKVGKCFIAVAVPGKIEVNEYDFEGTREEITESGIAHAQFLLYRKIKMAYN